MRMFSSSLLSLSALVLLFSISSAYTSDQNPFSIINGMEAKNSQQSWKSQHIIVGRWRAQLGKSNGKDFDDGAYTGIREINLAYNKETAIGCLQVVYDLNGSPFVGENHTSFISRFTPIKISLDFPTEFIVEVSGHISVVSGYTVVRPLTFKTNKATHGPYEVTRGAPFILPIENSLVVEFKEGIDYWLDHLSIYLSL